MNVELTLWSSLTQTTTSKEPINVQATAAGPWLNSNSGTSDVCATCKLWPWPASLFARHPRFSYSSPHSPHMELNAYMAVLMTPKKSSLTVPMQNCNQQRMAEQSFRVIGLKQRVAGAA